MTLPLRMPFAPMEALSVDAIPAGPQWQYEPKWDGFRTLVFADGKKLELQSKSGRSMTRYFPEVVEALRALAPKKFLLDGEIAVPSGGGFSFDALLQRVHPAASRVRKLATETPAIFIAFDLLVDADGRDLTAEVLAERRRALEVFFRRYGRGAKLVRLSPATTRLADAKGWLKRVGATLDGVIAKRRDFAYRSGDRTGMQKIKNYRSADCVVGGFRYNANSPLVGSLLLGLYDSKGLLHHVGFTSSIKREDKPALTKKLKALIAAPGFTGNAPGGPSRWSTERSGEWQPLKPKLVVEVCYDHFSGDRCRHGTRLLRWRPDKAPRQCTLDQVKQKKANLLALLS
ncbi:MAG TPA: ATP-dependent DNA ligase [Xanthobacteraceae bacterium]|nr:ATP-dependent DNA ligase [Xanthobacteraceae bacterium]